jgi:hypothetical protein
MKESRRVGHQNFKTGKEGKKVVHGVRRKSAGGCFNDTNGGCADYVTVRRI